MAVAIQHQHPASDSTAAEPSLRLFTIDELEAMVRHGIIGPDERVELIEGRVVTMNPQGRRHIWAATRTARIFNRRDDCIATGQSTLELPDGSAPEPDVAVLRIDASDEERPLARDVLLIVEVADSTITYDRLTKGPLYARAGVPEYWIVDINGEAIEVYREPSATGYRTQRVCKRYERLSPAFAPDLVLTPDTILTQPKPAAEQRPADG